MTEPRIKFCGDTSVHGWHDWGADGDHMMRCDGLDRFLCPDGGACHHMCGHEGYTEGCFRVIFAGPLSGVYPGNVWPKEVRKANGAWLQFDTMVEVVEQRITDHLLADTEKPVSEVVPCDHAEFRNNAWVCIDCVAEVGMKTTLALVIDRIEALARDTEAEAEKEGRSNPTLRTIKLIRAQGMRDVITMLEEKE